MSTGLTLTIPTFGGHPDNLRRTIASVPMATETVIVSTAIFDDDVEVFRSLAGKVVELPWNTVFLHGFGHIYNQGSTVASQPWQLLLGVAETIAEEYTPILEALARWTPRHLHRIDHRGDAHRWKRFWNASSGTKWDGIIHEEITGGPEGNVIARMQDTAKTPCDDPFRNEVLKWIKTCSYNHLYQTLGNHPERLGGTNAGWLSFLRGARESIDAFCLEHSDLISAAIAGNKDAFLDGVRRRMDGGTGVHGVNFNPQGEERTGNETITV